MNSFLSRSIKSCGALTKKEYNFSNMITKQKPKIEKSSTKINNVSLWAARIAMNRTSFRLYATHSSGSAPFNQPNYRAPKLDTSLLNDPNRHLERYQVSNYILALAAPAAILFAPTSLLFPIDLVLGFAIPYHAYQGMSAVIEDYVPEGTERAANSIFLILSILAAIGFLRLNLEGEGITNTIRGLWSARNKQVEEEE